MPQHRVDSLKLTWAAHFPWRKGPRPGRAQCNVTLHHGPRADDVIGPHTDFVTATTSRYLVTGFLLDISRGLDRSGGHDCHDNDNAFLCSDSCVLPTSTSPKRTSHEETRNDARDAQDSGHCAASLCDLSDPPVLVLTLHLLRLPRLFGLVLLLLELINTLRGGVRMSVCLTWPQRV
jgi:hypothetical protein